MCLTVPARIEGVETDATGARWARVDFGGLERRVSLLYTPEAEVGEYVLVQAGFATDRIAEPEALAAIAAAREVGEHLRRAATADPTAAP
ncbi:MAG TPA: HypC/HybG/HupF family hydrogenase formation chaperone [Thermoplasmata archaeon]|nr:HypC/HybG/HupF family hydrogenase formation chaperone [Thermoplasmata archaeon]